MANLTDKGKFKKGQSGNPNGRPSHPPEVREASKMTKTQILEVLGHMMTLRKSDVVKLLKDDNTPMFKRAVAAIFLQTVDSACEKKLDFILNRLIGKVTDRVEVDTKKPVIIRYPAGEDVYLGPPPEEDKT